MSRLKKKDEELEKSNFYLREDPSKFNGKQSLTTVVQFLLG